MARTFFNNGFLIIALMTLATVLYPHEARSVVLGVTGPTFSLTALEGSIRTSDGDSIPMWGYAVAGNAMQFPGPTLIVTQGATVSITLTNQLRLPVSLVIPGQKVTVSNSSGGVPGLLTMEVPPDNGVSSVTYTFTAAQPGTYTYYSGTEQELEVEMGLQGAIVVRPTGFDPTTAAGRRAYTDPSTAYDREYLMLLSEVDVDQHKAVGHGDIDSFDHTDRRPVTWFENGRTMPDTMADAGATIFPNQPYNSLPISHPGEKILIRFVGAGLDLHPLHTHGQNHLVIARDGRVLNSSTSNDLVPDLGVSDYTTTVVPGETVDALYGIWTGGRLNWDVYGPKEGAPANGPNGFNRTINWSQFLPLQQFVAGHTCLPTGPAPCYPTAAIYPACAALCVTNTMAALPFTLDPNCFDPVSHEYCPDHDKDFPLQLPTQDELTFGFMFGGTPFFGVPQSIPPVNTNNGLFHDQQNPNAGISFMWHSHNEREITTNDIFIGGMATMSLIIPYSVSITDLNNDPKP
jgi:plastocyanin